MRWAALVLVTAGCNQIYGLDPTRLAPDAAQHVVTGRLLHRWAENDADGKPVLFERALHQTNDVYLTVRIGDESTDLTLGDAGDFTFTRPAADTPYQLVITLEGEIIEMHDSAPDVSFVVRTAGRFDAAPIKDPKTVTFPFTSGTSAGAIASTGIWAYAEAQPSSYSFDWERASAFASRRGLLDATRNDVFYYFDFASRMADGQVYASIAGAASAPLVMGMAGVTMAEPPPRVTAAPCAMLTGAIAAEANRFATAAPLFARSHDEWNIVALPSLELGFAGAIKIAFGSKYGMPTDLAITPSIYNPIAGSTTAAVASSVLYRFVRHPDSAFAQAVLPVLSHVVPVVCGSAPIVVPASNVGIPTAPRLAGIALDRDDAEVRIDATGDLELAWTTASGTADYYSVVLEEVRNEGFDSTALVAVRTFQTSQPRVSIDPASLVRGRHYLIQIDAYTGFPDARAGDLRRITYPLSTARVFTSMFRIR